MKKLHPSSAAFMWGEAVVTGYSSGCLRQVLLGSKGVRTEIPEEYMRVGAAHELQHEQGLKADANIESFEREKVVRIPIEGFDDIQYSGRIDFLTVHKVVGKVVDETKGTISKNTRLSVIRKGKPKINQLAQLVSYMIAEETTFGRLVCGYYEEDEDRNLIKLEERIFKVQIDDEGTVLIDGLPSGYTVFDQMAHRTACAEVITQETIAARPSGWEDKYKGPCGWCAFKATCDKHDNQPLTTEEFVASAKVDAEIAEINRQSKPEPQPNKIKVKKFKEKS